MSRVDIQVLPFLPPDMEAEIEGVSEDSFNHFRAVAALRFDPTLQTFPRHFVQLGADIDVTQEINDWLFENCKGFFFGDFYWIVLDRDEDVAMLKLFWQGNP